MFFSATMGLMPEINAKQIAQLESVLVVLQEVVDYLLGQSVTISPEVAERIEKFRREARCLFCEDPLGDEKVTRGCHQVCYGKVNRKIKSNKFTRQYAVDQGWLNPIDEPPGPKTERPDPTRQPTNRPPEAKQMGAQALEKSRKIERSAKRSKK